MSVHEVTVDVPDGLWMTSNMRLHWARKAERSRGLRYLGLCAVRHVPAMARAHIGPDMRLAPQRAPKHHHHITFTIEELDHE